MLSVGKDRGIWYWLRGASSRWLCWWRQYCGNPKHIKSNGDGPLYQEMCARIDPLRPSDSYGIDIFVETVSFIAAHSVSQRRIMCRINWLVPCVFWGARVQVSSWCLAEKIKNWPKPTYRTWTKNMQELQHIESIQDLRPQKSLVKNIRALWFKPWPRSNMP